MKKKFSKINLDIHSGDKSDQNGIFYVVTSCFVFVIKMCFKGISDPGCSFLNSFKLNLEEWHLACGFKCTPRN